VWGALCYVIIVGAVDVSGVNVAYRNSCWLMYQQTNFLPQSVNGDITVRLSGQ
jgi:hypothetical protein